jgi:long-chain acyl-CoA synthetase
MSHLLLGVPTSRLHPSARSAGPIFASHFYDLQIPAVPNYLAPLTFESDAAERAHTGPPAVNIEVKLVGKKVDSEIQGGEPLEGQLWAGGPGLLERANRDGSRTDR